MKVLGGVTQAMFSLAVLSIPLYAAFKSMAADGKVDYCYVESHGFSRAEKALYAHRPWRPDRHLGTYMNMEDAIEATKKYGCEIK